MARQKEGIINYSNSLLLLNKLPQSEDNNNYLRSHSVSEGQEFRSGLAAWFLFMVSHEDTPRCHQDCRHLHVWSGLVDLLISSIEWG